MLPYAETSGAAPTLQDAVHRTGGPTALAGEQLDNNSAL